MSSCLICTNKVENNFTITNCKCNIIYHTKCYEEWINISRSCPTCRHIYKIKPCKDNNYQENKININTNILRIMSGLGGLSFSN